ncbi:MAG: glycosyltransferase family 39 protein [Candidatus Doudnabacteria bacterium]|nr:glycosyltransferase family 39 protein [Candidatus Doudnabacteria bacterium]
MKKFIKNNWALLLVLALAVFFRFWQINTLPGGLFPDEAANGLDINNMFHGQIQPFYERGNGREALFFYFLAASVALFGRGPWQHHIISAGFGVAAVLAAYFLTKRLFGKRIALLASFLMAVSSYAVTVERTAFRANTVPLLATLTLLFLVKFFQTEDKKIKYWSAAAAGMSFALGFYTYTSFRMMVPLVLGFAVLLWLANRSRTRELIREYTKYKATFVAAFILGISWLATYFIAHPGSFVGRAGQVSVFNKELNNGDLIGTIIDVFRKTVLSFFTDSDLNWRHNVSGFPFLSPFISPFFAAAVIWFTITLLIFLRQVWSQKIQPDTTYKALLACWFWFMLVPEISTAEGIPHGLRLIGVMPVIFILAAWAIVKIWDVITSHEMTWPKYYFAAVFLSVIAIYNFYLYFVVAAGSTEYYYAFRSDLTDVSNYLNQRNLKDRTYLSLDTFSVQTTDYLTTPKNQPYILVDPAHTYEVKLKKGDQVVFTMSTLFDRLKFMQNHPTTRLVRVDRNQFGQVIMLVYEQN